MGFGDRNGAPRGCTCSPNRGQDDPCCLVAARCADLAGSCRRSSAPFGYAARAVLVAVLVATSLVVVARPAGACSCAAPAEPAFDFTGRAVEDLGYTGEDGSADAEHRWRIEVVDGRRGVVTGNEVRVSMVVGEQRRGDSVMVNTCGLDDNLVVGAAYEIRTSGLDRMSACGSSVTGARVLPPDLEPGGNRVSGTGVVVAAGAAALLALTGGLVVRRLREPREDLHKRR